MLFCVSLCISSSVNMLFCVSLCMYRRYHNQIKFSLYHMTNPRKSPKRLLDIGCGQGGDISKWRRTKFGLVVGLDKVPENIHRAQSRLNNVKSLDREKIHLFAADMSQPVDNTMLPKDVERFESLLNTKNTPAQFDVVSCQFALHYFFKNRETWTGFVNNVQTYLKPGGVFIGTCMNGVKVDQMFRSGRTSEITGPFGRIRKKYSTDNFAQLAVPLGQTIETFIESIGTSNDEYLVDVNWFVHQMKLHNIELYHPKRHPVFEFGTASFGDIYDAMRHKNRKIDLPENQKEFSFLNHYFILRRGPKDTEFDYASDAWNSFADPQSDTVRDVVDTFYANGYVVDETFGQSFFDRMEVVEEVVPEESADTVAESTSDSVTLRSIHAYKLGELKTLAQQNNISTTKQGKKKTISRTKGELYAELKKLG